MKLLIGGSPCTHWSVAQSKDRETQPKGIGWDLFENYLIAKAKFHPDYFLYENNKSMAAPIREQITRELGVEPILINSALVSAQTRQRLYWTNIPGVKQPEDRGIVIRDILEIGKDSVRNIVGNTVNRRTYIAQPICVNSKSGRNGIPGLQPSIEHRIYSIDGKGTAVTTAFRPQIAIPIRITTSLSQSDFTIVVENGKKYPIYYVHDGKTVITGEPYPIKLEDGYYIIRKLTVKECMRLQTVPEEYIFPVSETQAYKMLGNGWTVDVISHILSYCPNIIAEPLTVLSMYDGMSCGRLALNKLGAQIDRYYACEIDKYAIQTTQHNFPDTIQLGDAFQVRDTPHIALFSHQRSDVQDAWGNEVPGEGAAV